MVNVTVFLIESNKWIKLHLNIDVQCVVTQRGNIMKDKLKLVKEAIKWAKETVETKAKINHTGLCMSQFDNSCFFQCFACEECLELYKEEQEV